MAGDAAGTAIEMHATLCLRRNSAPLARGSAPVDAVANIRHYDYMN